MAKGDIAFALTSSFVIGAFGANIAHNLYLFLIIILLGLSPALAPREPKLIIFIICLIGVMSGYFYCEIHSKKIFSDSFVSGIIRVTSDPMIGDDNIRASAELINEIKDTEFDLIVPSETVIAYCDSFEIKGDVKDGAVVYPEMRAIGKRDCSIVKSSLYSIKRKYIEAITMAVPKRMAALMSGLTVGDRGGFDVNFKKEMKASGTTHLVALSGYNIAILISAAHGALGNVFSRKILAALTIILILIFVVMVGGEASIVRAAIMGALTLLAIESGRNTAMRLPISISAFAMTLQNPSVAKNDLGFILSFLSLIGIVYLGGAIKNRFSAFFKESLFDWREHFAATVSAQTMVAPVLLLVFGSTSALGIFANVLIVPFVPLMMLGAFLVGSFGMINSVVATATGFIFEPLFSYSLFIIKIFARAPGTITLPSHPELIFAGYYLLLLAFIINNHEA